MDSKFGYWGDDPQDETDAWVKRQTKGHILSITERKALFSKGLRDKALKNKVDKWFKREWDRKSREKEFTNHLKVSCGLGKIQ